MLDRVYLGKYIKDDLEKIDDSTLRERLKRIVEKINYKESTGDIDSKEAKKFLACLSRLELDAFNTTYDILNTFLSYSREDIKNNLKYVDGVLKTGVFNSKKIDATTFSEHVFSLSDLISFVMDLNSKIGLHGSTKIKQFTDFNTSDLSLIVDHIENNDKEVVDNLLEDYRNWYNLLSNYDNEMVKSVYETIKNNESKALILLHNRMRSYINKCNSQAKIELENSFRSHSHLYNRSLRILR